MNLEAPGVIVINAGANKNKRGRISAPALLRALGAFNGGV